MALVCPNLPVLIGVYCLQSTSVILVDARHCPVILFLPCRLHNWLCWFLTTTALQVSCFHLKQEIWGGPKYLNNSATFQQQTTFLLHY